VYGGHRYQAGDRHAQGPEHAQGQDVGHTEFKQPTYTCCAIGPAKADAIDEITGKLVLL